jgi:hypothetical protein
VTGAAGGGKTIPTLESLRQQSQDPARVQPQIVVQRMALEGMPCTAAMAATRYGVHFHRKTINRWIGSDSYLSTFAILYRMRNPEGIRR